MKTVHESGAADYGRPASGVEIDKPVRQAMKEGRRGATAPAARPGYLRKGDAARYLSVSVRTLTAWMQRGIVGYMKLSRKVCLFRQEDLDAAMARYRVKALRE